MLKAWKQLVVLVSFTERQWLVIYDWSICTCTCFNVVLCFTEELENNDMQLLRSTGCVSRYEYSYKRDKFLDQVCTSCSLAHAWFLKITFVQEVSMCVYLPLRLLISSSVMWRLLITCSVMWLVMYFIWLVKQILNLYMGQYLELKLII